jgi:hypothetical protein
MTSIPTARVVTLAKAEKQFTSAFLCTHHRPTLGKRPVLVHDTDLAIKGDLELAKLAEDYAALIVRGNLVVSGSIIDHTPAIEFVFEVQGTTGAKNLLAGGSRIQLWRNVRIANVFYTHDPDGYAHVLCDVRAKTIIRGGANVDFDGKMNGTYVDLRTKANAAKLVYRTKAKLLAALTTDASASVARS